MHKKDSRDGCSRELGSLWVLNVQTLFYQERALALRTHSSFISDQLHLFSEDSFIQFIHSSSFDFSAFTSSWSSFLYNPVNLNEEKDHKWICFWKEPSYQSSSRNGQYRQNDYSLLTLLYQAFKSCTFPHVSNHDWLFVLLILMILHSSSYQSIEVLSCLSGIDTFGLESPYWPKRCNCFSLKTAYHFLRAPLSSALRISSRIPHLDSKLLTGWISNEQRPSFMLLFAAFWSKKLVPTNEPWFAELLLVAAVAALIVDDDNVDIIEAECDGVAAAGNDDVVEDNGAELNFWSFGSIIIFVSCPWNPTGLPVKKACFSSSLGSKTYWPRNTDLEDEFSYSFPCTVRANLILVLQE